MSEEEQNLTVGDPETFVGELEKMDIDALRDKQFMVAISTGPREKCNFICNTMRGPFDFYEMCEHVSRTYEVQQLHAKAIVVNSDFNVPFEFLDECTIDYIEANAGDIVVEGLLNGAFDPSEDYTCKAGVLQHEEDEDEDDTEEV